MRIVKNDAVDGTKRSETKSGCVFEGGDDAPARTYAGSEVLCIYVHTIHPADPPGALIYWHAGKAMQTRRARRAPIGIWPSGQNG